MSDWIGTLSFDPPPPSPSWKKGDRISIPSIDRDSVWVVDDVSEPDVDGVIRATVHVETHESPAQPSEED